MIKIHEKKTAIEVKHMKIAKRKWRDDMTSLYPNFNAKRDFGKVKQVI